MSQTVPDQPSANTPAPSRPTSRGRPMQLVAEREAPEPVPPSPTPIPTPTASTSQPQLAAELLNRQAWRSGVLGSLNLAARVLAVRLILLLAVFGAIALDILVLRTPETAHLAVLGIYTVTVVLPIVWLSSR